MSTDVDGAAPEDAAATVPDTDKAGQDTGPVTRGFLFADLRGYTEFVERAGDSRAADLLERYRALVRGVVARRGGAEIKTEGDSFYIVFSSASGAVRAGLDLAAAAARDQHPDPIRVGVGIHAGEAAEGSEGYVGSAVNIAARVCAQAAAGEVLVTETVRWLTRTSGDLAFVARGRRTLKGVSEPVVLYQVRHSSGEAAPAGARGRARGRWIAAVAFVGAVVVGGLGIRALIAGASSSVPPGGSNGSAASEAPTDANASPRASSPTPSGLRPLAFGPLEAGTYLVQFDPDLEITFPLGWNVLAFSPGFFAFTNRVDYDPPFEGVVMFRPSVAITPCTAEKETALLPESVAGVAAWLQHHPQLTVSDPWQERFGPAGADTVGLDVADTKPCPGTATRTTASLFDVPVPRGLYTDPRGLFVAGGRAERFWFTTISGEVVAIGYNVPVGEDADVASRPLLTVLGTMRPIG